MIKPRIKERSPHPLRLHLGLDVGQLAIFPVEMVIASIQSNPVTAFLEQIREARNLCAWRLAEARAAKTNRRAPGEDGHPGRRTLRGGRIGAVEAHALAGERI